MPSRKLASFAFTVLSLTAVGCAAAPDDPATDDDEVSADEALKAASIAEGTFKLYAQPRAVPSETCDVHTLLSLTNKGGAKAALREALGSTPGMPQCKLFVQPNPREYRLRFDGTACGSKIYSGKKKVEGVWRSIKITDHRTRMCRDLVPAKIIVEETGADGVKYTKYSFDGAPKPVTTWLTIAPKQCGSNPWNGFVPAKGTQPSHLDGEKGDVANFLSSKGIAVEQIGFLYPSEPRFVCLACSCPRGDNLVVRATTAADAQRLQTELGFAPLMGTALTTAPKQCGSNPWEGGMQTTDDRAETQNLVSWAQKQGAPLTSAGFTDSTVIRFQCQACSCARGDTALALTQDAAAATKLENLGWQRVEN